MPSTSMISLQPRALLLAVVLHHAADQHAFAEAELFDHRAGHEGIGALAIVIGRRDRGGSRSRWGAFRARPSRPSAANSRRCFLRLVVAAALILAVGTAALLAAAPIAAPASAPATHAIVGVVAAVHVAPAVASAGALLLLTHSTPKILNSNEAPNSGAKKWKLEHSSIVLIRQTVAQSAPISTEAPIGLPGRFALTEPFSSYLAQRPLNAFRLTEIGTIRARKTASGLMLVSRRHAADCGQAKSPAAASAPKWRNNIARSIDFWFWVAQRSRRCHPLNPTSKASAGCAADPFSANSKRPRNNHSCRAVIRPLPRSRTG